MMANTQTYRWKVRVYDAEAEEVGRELERICEATEGVMQAEDIVAASKAKRALLHDYFEWDDAIAGHLHRCNQARTLLSAVRVVHQTSGGEEHLVRGFVHVNTEAEGPHYTTLTTALSDEEKRAQVLERAWRELQAWRERYADYEELAAVFAKIDAQAKRRKAG